MRSSQLVRLILTQKAESNVLPQTFEILAARR
jgi:hypothetical protein